MNRVVHFEVQAEDPNRAAEFYQKVFGWQFRKWDGPDEYWFITTGEAGTRGINGGLVRRKKSVSGQGVIAFVCTVHVESVEEALASIEANGGSLAEPKVAIPDTGWLAYCRDTEGNIFAVIEYGKPPV